ncbi:MAG: SOS response-associated peptidase [Firmicutes bacterium]|nr:SOS response-associated peptidase [Bacillota bacterium]
MCARYEISPFVIERIKALAESRSEVCDRVAEGEYRPSQEALVITGQEGRLTAAVMAWGYPRRDGKGLIINARSETILEKRSFRRSALATRCVVPASSFFEWDYTGEPVVFTVPEQPVLYLAGIWDHFDGEDRFTILTTEAKESMRPFHDRMPLILEESEIRPWILEGDRFHLLLKKEMPRLESFRETEQLSFF